MRDAWGLAMLVAQAAEQFKLWTGEVSGRCDVRSSSAGTREQVVYFLRSQFQISDQEISDLNLGFEI